MALQELDFGSLPVKNRIDRVAEETAKGTALNFGLLHEGKRTEEQNRQKDKIVGALPRFNIRGSYVLEQRRYALWKYSRQLLGGKDPAWIWQQTGSCVGAGWGNMSLVTQGVEIVLKGDFEEYRWLWWLYTYGKGRQRGGIHGQGEGSFGTAQAEAATKDGSYELDPIGEPDLQDPKITSGWSVHPSSLEMQWSDGRSIPANWNAVAAKHLFKTAAIMRSADDCIAALANGYAITQASSFGFSPMVPPVKGSGENAVRLVERWNATWNHQTWVDEFWDNPDVGPIFHWGNNWGPTAHYSGGQTPNGCPNTGPYITYSLMDQICKSRDGEVIAFSSYDGFPAREAKLREADFSSFRRPLRSPTDEDSI